MLVLERVVAEQAEMARPAAGRDAGQDRDAQAADLPSTQGVEVRRAGRFQLGLAARLERQAAQAVGHQQDDLAGVAER